MFTSLVSAAAQLGELAVSACHDFFPLGTSDFNLKETNRIFTR